MNEVTRVLQEIQEGEPQAAERLLPLVYDELRRLARAKLNAEQAGQTLEATALVHEAYLRLLGPGDEPAWDSRGHFFAAAAEAMRRILVDNARRKRRLKHGGDREREFVPEESIVAPQVQTDLVELDAALEKFGQEHPRQATLVKLRYFAGLSQKQAALSLGIGISTADRDWAYARAWLLREMKQAGGGGEEN